MIKTMKKTFYSMFLAFILIAGAYASACATMNFDDADICINIDKDGWNYTLETNIEANTNIAITCNILLPNGSNRNISNNNCQWSFEYSHHNTEKVKLYVVVNGQYKTIEKYYDFDQWKRDGDTTTTTTNGDLDDFSITVSDTTPDKNQRVDFSINALDINNDTITNYEGKVRFSVQRKDNNGDWIDASSSYYNLDREYYNFDSYDDGTKTLHDLIKFTREYQFRVKVYDDDDHTIYKYVYFDVNGTNTTNLHTKFSITANPKNPEKYERIDLTIEATDIDNIPNRNYEWTLKLRVEKKSWNYRIIAPSSEYNLDNTTIDINDNNYGKIKTNNIIKFKNDGNYRIKVYDKNDSTTYGYIVFQIGTSYEDSTSNIDWFTNKELNQIQAIYTIWPNVIKQLSADYYKLRHSEIRLEQTTQFYDNMAEVINDKSYRTFDNYDDFFDAFLDRYTLTISTR